MIKKWILGSIAFLLAVLLIVGCILISKFQSDGIHFLAGCFHLLTARKCYLISNGEVIGETFVAMDGYVRNKEFQGYLYADTHPIPLHEAIARNTGKDSGGFPVFIFGNYADIVYEDIWPESEGIQHSTYSYVLTLNREAPEQFIFYIYTANHKQSIGAAVPANSEQEALETLQAHTAARNGK